MFSSPALRERLRRVNTDPLRLERRDPHRTCAIDPAARPAPGDFTVDGPWQIVTNVDDEVGALLADDLTDFFQHMQIPASPAAPATVTFSIDPDLPDRDCRLRLAPDTIEIVGGGNAGLWTGLAWMEDEMRSRRGPFLPQGTFERHARWPVQISQGPWSASALVPDLSPDVLSDDGFRLAAHLGINSIMIYGDLLQYVSSDILPELNCAEFDKNMATLRDAAQRAARYGVRFSYLAVGPKLKPEHPVFRAHPDVKGAGVDHGVFCHFLCSSNAKVLAFYEETFSKLFSTVPELAGTILIAWSESFYHCEMWNWGNCAPEPCTVCGARSVHEMVAGMVAAVERGVQSAGTDAYTAEWIYTWAHGDRRPAFDLLPESVGVFHHIEKDHVYHKDGYTKNIWDYSIDYRGPSPAMQEIAEFAHEKGRKLFVKTETGAGLEVFQFPYVPAMQHLGKKWEGVRSLKPWGVHQAWLFFGIFGSRAEELGLWATYDRNTSLDDCLRRLAVRDFGPDAADEVLAAWQCMSEAVTHLPCVTLLTYYIGPTFLGPAHPLMPSKGMIVPPVFHSSLWYLQEHGDSYSTEEMEVRHSMVLSDLPETVETLRMVPDDPDSDGWDIVIREYRAAASHALRAVEHLDRAAAGTDTQADANNLREERALTELIYRTFTACRNTIDFLRERRAFEETGERRHRVRMCEIARDERQNALASVPIYREHRWLDLSERTDGTFASCVDMIDEKVRIIDRFIDEGNNG